MPINFGVFSCWILRYTFDMFSLTISCCVRENDISKGVCLQTIYTHIFHIKYNIDNCNNYYYDYNNNHMSMLIINNLLLLIY